MNVLVRKILVAKIECTETEARWLADQLERMRKIGNWPESHWTVSLAREVMARPDRTIVLDVDQTFELKAWLQNATEDPAPAFRSELFARLPTFEDIQSHRIL